MKPLLPFLLYAAVALGQADATPPAASPQPIPVDQENANRARAVLDQAIEALGGQAYLTYQDRSEEGRFYTLHHGQSNSLGAPFGRYSKFPDKERVDILKMRNYHFLIFDVGNVAAKNKDDIVVIHTGDKGYEITYKGTAAEKPSDTAEYLRRRERSLDWVLRKWLNEPGVALFYEGTTVAAQKDVLQVTIMNARNQAVTLYIDARTYLPVKKKYSWRDPTDKERNVEEEVYDNYRPTQGIMTAFSVTRYYNGDMTFQRFINSVVYNKGLSDSWFDARVTYDPNTPAVRK